MKVIVKPGEKVSKLWGIPKPREKNYRLIQYVLRETVPDGELLHHTLTGELVLLTQEESEALNRLPGKLEEALLPLMEAHFVVEEDFDEGKALRQFRSILQAMNQSKNITGYTILPTTHCNARCFYCYESELERMHMSEQTANELVEFIKAHRGDEPVHIEWFGGEPLVGEKRIDQISEGLKAAEIPYTASMISNGYLFTEEMVHKAKELWKLNSIQITLDGTEEVYNRVKAYVGVQGSPYQRVLNSIELLLKEEIHVSIRMNMDKHNHEDLEKLIDLLAERFGGQKGFNVNVALITEDCGFEPIHRKQEDTDNANHWLRNLRKKIQSVHLDTPDCSLPRIKYRYCMADNRKSVIIMPDGTFRKCEHYTGIAPMGNLKEGWTDFDTLRSYQKPFELNLCKNCPMRPSCYHLDCCINHDFCSVIDCDEQLSLVKNNMHEIYQKGRCAPEENCSETGRQSYPTVVC